MKYGTKEFWENIYSGEKSREEIGYSWKARQLYRYETYLSFLLKSSVKFSNICDIGCSYGDFTFMLKETFLPDKIKGIDHSKLVIEEAKRNFVDKINKKYGDGNLDINSGIFTPKTTEKTK